MKLPDFSGALVKLEAGIILLLVILVLAFVLPAFEGATVLLQNATDEYRKVTISAPDKEQLVVLDPGQDKRIALDGEGGVLFRVESKRGDRYETEPVYFSSGIKIQVIVDYEQVTASYNSD